MIVSEKKKKVTVVGINGIRAGKKYNIQVEYMKSVPEVLFYIVKYHK